MAHGSLTPALGSTVNVDGGKITAPLVMTCVIAASSGLIFGYDIGISGGVTMMPPFLEKFFPSVIKKSMDVKTNLYCVYDSHALTAFTSSLFLAGLVTSLFASRLTASFGRRATITLGGLTFLAGAAANATAANLSMLIAGRILLGFGVGFTNQATPMYLSEVAPPRLRGAFAIGFQFFIAVGVLAANCINFATARFVWGWRLSLGLGAVPAVIMTVGSLFIPDTPTSLLARGKHEEAHASLQRIRGSGKGADVEAELAELVESNRLDEKVRAEPFAAVLERKHRPHLVVALMVPFFQQLTGINVIAFYAPVLFRSVGFGPSNAIIGSIILGLVNLGSITVSATVVDRFGRRFLFILGGVQMLICQVIVAAVLGVATAGAASNDHIPKGYAVAILTMLCVYTAGFGWSWGPLCWLVPSEIFPARIRPAGQSINVAVNFATTFVLAQMFLAMLCGFKYGIFLFYGGWIVVMTAFVVVFLPETKGIPMDSMNRVWEAHWYWKRFVRDENDLKGKH